MSVETNTIGLVARTIGVLQGIGDRSRVLAPATILKVLFPFGRMFLVGHSTRGLHLSSLALDTVCDLP